MNKDNSMYKRMLEMDLQHEKHSWHTDIEEQEEIYREKKLTFSQAIEEIDKYSDDLPPYQKRCFLCNGIATGETYKAGYCDCNFLMYDHDYNTGKYSRYGLDYERIKYPDTIETKEDKGNTLTDDFLDLPM